MTSNEVLETIKDLLAKSDATEVSHPQQSCMYAEQAHSLAAQHQLYYEQCFALLQICNAKEGLAENNHETEALLAQAISLAEQHEFTELLIRAFSKMASLLSTINRIDEAASYITKAKNNLQHLERPKPSLEMLVLYDDINIRYRKGESGASLLNDCLAGKQMTVEQKNEGLHTGFLQVLTMITAKMGDTEASLKYSKQFIEIEEKRNFQMALVGAYTFQSSLYEKMGRKEDALNSLNKAVASSKKLGDVRSYLFVEIRRINVFIASKETEKARKACLELLAIPELNEMPKIRYDVISAMAQIATEQNNPDEAISLLETERQVFLGDKITLQKITNHLYELYATVGKYELAYKSLLENKTITEEIYHIEKAKEYAELHARFETKEKEAELRETQLQKLEAELKAIKSQMNPHFAFNSLKTIDYLLEQNNVSSARQSLNAFAQLMRATLQQSGSEFTVIEDELLLLENYIRLEKNTLDDLFTYEIVVAENIDPNYDRVPSIFLQPVVENAIKHGLRHKKGHKHLRIVFKTDGDELQVIIQDNGIGRTASAAINKFRTNHHSFAGNAMEKRVEFYNEKAGYKKFIFEIEDLDEGTKATLRIRQSEL